MVRAWGVGTVLSTRRGVLGGQVKVLVAEGKADIEARDCYCMDPLDESMRCRKDAVADWLRKHGAIIGGRSPI